MTFAFGIGMFFYGMAAMAAIFIGAIIAYNLKEPVITVKTSKSNTYAHEVKIKGPSKVIYSPDKPLSCGARVWIETESEVIVL